MRVESAIELVHHLVYKPGWVISARDATNRHENTILLHVEYPTQETARPDAQEGYPKNQLGRADFYIMLGAECDDIALYRKVIQRLLEIEEHEAREFLRVQPSLWAPFHPHQCDGIHRWSGDNVDRDLMFGIAK